MKYLKIKIPEVGVTKIPFLEIQGKNTGRTCVISGGMHGDEVNGIYLVKEFLDYCKKNKIEKKLQGKIVVIPILNQSGFEKKMRHVGYDLKDLNRAFNRKKNKTASNFIADALEKEFYADATIAIDCHDSGKRSFLIPHSRVHSSEKTFCKECTKEMAMAFGSKIIVEREGRRGMLAIEMGRKYSLPVLTLEIGGALKIFRKYLDEGLQGIVNILTHHGFLDEEMVIPRKQFYLKDRFGVKAADSGILIFNKKLGQRVHVGQKIGEIYVPGKSRVVTLEVPMCGMIFSMQYINSVTEGEIMYSILEDKECHLKKRKTLDKITEIVNIRM